MRGVVRREVRNIAELMFGNKSVQKKLIKAVWSTENMMAGTTPQN
jgi:hypothetical protein